MTTTTATMLIRTYCTAEEHAEITRLAEAAKLSLGAYLLRRALPKASPPKVEPPTAVCTIEGGDDLPTEAHPVQPRVVELAHGERTLRVQFQGEIAKVVKRIDRRLNGYYQVEGNLISLGREVRLPVGALVAMLVRVQRQRCGISGGARANEDFGRYLYLGRVADWGGVDWEERPALNWDRKPESCLSRIEEALRGAPAEAPGALDALDELLAQMTPKP